MTRKKLNDILKFHKNWLKCKQGGEKINLSGEGLSNSGGRIQWNY